MVYNFYRATNKLIIASGRIWCLNIVNKSDTKLSLVAPSIESVPEDGNIVVHAGAGVTIQCRARGNPSPRISWSWQV